MFSPSNLSDQSMRALIEGVPKVSVAITDPEDFKTWCILSEMGRSLAYAEITDQAGFADHRVLFQGIMFACIDALSQPGPYAFPRETCQKFIEIEFDWYHRVMRQQNTEAIEAGVFEEQADLAIAVNADLRQFEAEQQAGLN